MPRSLIVERSVSSERGRFIRIRTLPSEEEAFAHTPSKE